MVNANGGTLAVEIYVEVNLAPGRRTDGFISKIELFSELQPSQLIYGGTTLESTQNMGLTKRFGSLMNRQ